MLTEKIESLDKKRAEVAALEKEIKDELKSELRGLPTKYGFKTAGELHAAILAAKKSGASTKPRKPKVDLTDSVKDKVMEMTARRVPAEQIAKELNISLGSVANIRRDRAPKLTPSAAGT